MIWMKILLCLAAVCVLVRAGDGSECIESKNVTYFPYTINKPVGVK